MVRCPWSPAERWRGPSSAADPCLDKASAGVRGAWGLFTPWLFGDSAGEGKGPVLSRPSSHISVGVLSPQLSCPGCSSGKGRQVPGRGTVGGGPLRSPSSPRSLQSAHHPSAIASWKTVAPAGVWGGLGLASAQGGAKVSELPPQALTGERLGLTDRSTHGCISGDLGSHAFLRWPLSGPVARGQEPPHPVHGWPHLGGLGRGWFSSPQARVSETPGPAVQGWVGPSFVSRVGGLGGRRWAFEEQHRIGLQQDQEAAMFPTPCDQWTPVMLTWLAHTQQEPKGPRRFLGSRLVEGQQG